MGAQPDSLEGDAVNAGSVLVTGGTGYLAMWIIAGLLERSYRVRATVRDLTHADRVRQAVAEQTEPGNPSFVRADLLTDHGWDAAMEGVDYVQHLASPQLTDRSQDLVLTACEGMHRVLDAASKAGVRRVVLTSAAVAALPDRDDIVADETVWASPTDKPADRYARSKTLAERDAWAFVEATGTYGSPLNSTRTWPRSEPAWAGDNESTPPRPTRSSAGAPARPSNPSSTQPTASSHTGLSAPDLLIAELCTTGCRHCQPS